MKKCPSCNQTYVDDNLSFCLSDGSMLQAVQESDPFNPPPTVVMDYPRPTNDQYSFPNQQSTPPFGQMGSWQGNQPMQQPGMMQSQNQTLPTISLILGIFGLILICCYGGIPFGLAALVTGFLGMQNANNNPIQYGGKNMAIAGMILGAIGFVLNILYIILVVFSSIFS